jgi:hypothetical protein
MFEPVIAVRRSQGCPIHDDEPKPRTTVSAGAELMPAPDEDQASPDARSALRPLLHSHASDQRTSLLPHGRMCRQQMSEHPRLRNA